MTTQLGFARPWGTVPTTLDPLETSVEKEPADLAAEGKKPSFAPVACSRHVKWSDRRSRVFEGMRQAGLSYHRLEAFRTCGSSFWLLRDRTDSRSYMLCPDHCNDRFCEPCSEAKSRRIRESLREQLKGTCYRFLTLTIAHSQKPLSEQLDHLYQSFRRLRQRKLWSSCVDGGIAFLELTRNVDRCEWHPHLHCILEGRWIPVLQLRDAWRGVTGDSHVINLKLVRDKMAVASYVAKYATKPYTHREHYPQETLVEAIQALKGRRSIVTFGAIKPIKTRFEKSGPQWECLGHVNELPYGDLVPELHRQSIENWVQLCQERRALPTLVITDEIGKRGPPAV